MAKDAERSADDLARLRAAAAWRIQLADAGLETSQPFEAWLAADPRHHKAWRQVMEPWNQFEHQAGSPELLAARRGALERASGAGRAWWGPGPARNWRLVATMGAIVLSLTLVTAVWLLQPKRYETGFAERRIVRLEDGSRISLDAGSLLTVKFRAHVRELDLIRGQARFDVAHDAMRPFRVHARNQTVVALGTSFSVDLLGRSVLVTLVEGRVTVTPDIPRGPTDAGIRRSTPPTVLSPGQRLVAVADQRPPRIEQVSLDRATAWEAGKLVFEDEPLAMVAERVSRYSRRPIVVDDRRAAERRISGVFNAGDVTTFLDTVTQYLPVEVAPATEDRIELRSRLEKTR